MCTYIFLSKVAIIHNCSRSEEDIRSSLLPHKQRSFIVFEPALMLLFSMCTYCRSRCTKISKTVIGSFLRLTQSCKSCGCKFAWESQPFIGGTPAGNVLTSAAILYAGVIPAKALRIFRVLKCASISRKTFFRHQCYYLQPAVSHIWGQQQGALLEKMKKEKKKLTVGGDGRCDSPGHCAKYGTYTLLELSCNRIIDFKLVQVYCKVVIIDHVVQDFYPCRVMRSAEATTWKRRVLAEQYNICRTKA